MQIRIATPSDARRIAEIHVRAWRSGYHGIVPTAYLAGLSIDERELAWRIRLEKVGTHVWVAEDGDDMLGWISVAASRDPGATPTTGELCAIYIDPQHWRRGAGRALWQQAELYLKSAGFTDTTLWVLEPNAKAIAFYASLGFTQDVGVQKNIERGGTQLAEIRLRLRF